MESSVVAILLIIATLVLALGAFELYYVSFSNQYYTVSVQEYLIGVSKLISVEASRLTYAGLPPYYNYFNVSYVIWIQSPTKTLTVVPFVTSPQPNSFYTLPSSAQNASLFTSSLNGYSSLRPFNLSATVYLPQEGLALANIHVVAYNVSSNSTYVLSAIVRPGQIIMLWLLYYYDGKWYRLDYVYLSPFSSGLGVYIITGHGIYKGYNGTFNNLKVYICIPDPGFQLGMWFEVKNIQQSPTPLLNATFIPLPPPPGQPPPINQGEVVYVTLYTQGHSLYVNLYEPGQSLYPNGPKPQLINQTVLLYSNLAVGQPYFINFSCGDALHSDHKLNFSIFNTLGKLLNSTVLKTPPEVCNDTVILTFGSKNGSNGIYQAFLETIDNYNPTQEGYEAFYNVSNIDLRNGPLYNDTYLFNWTVAHHTIINELAYWYFGGPHNVPPPQLPGTLWYWPLNDSIPIPQRWQQPSPPVESHYPYIYYINETGNGTYKGYNGTLGYSGTLNNIKPYICIPDPGVQLGMWFEVKNIQQSPTPLLNATFIPYNLHAENHGYTITVTLYTKGSSLYVNVYEYETGQQPYNQTKLIYNNLTVGQPYFINISCGDALGTDHHMTFTIYNKQGELLNTTVVQTNPETDGDTVILTFGSETVSNGIYQAFLDTLQNNQGVNSFWNISNFILHNGPLYNDTYLFNWTVAHNPSLNSSAYWYFVWPYDNPPPQLPGVVWYWPSSTLKYPDIYYIPEIGTNSYVTI
jgi:hypothetical protein